MEQPTDASVNIVDAFFLAAKGGIVEDLKELFGVHGVDINVQDHLGNSGLHYAAHAGHAAAVSLLLHQPSIKINLTNNVGDTPLHKAVWRGNVEAVRMLVEAGADTNARNSSSLRPVDLAKDSTIASLLWASQNQEEYPIDSDEEEEEEGDEDSD